MAEARGGRGRLRTVVEKAKGRLNDVRLLEEKGGDDGDGEKKKKRWRERLPLWKKTLWHPIGRGKGLVIVFLEMHLNNFGAVA